MKRGELIGKIFGIALVFLMIGAMLGGLPALSVSRVEASPGTIYVPDDYTTIQAAVDAANPGDTIIVRNGTYTENVDVDKDHLIIQSESGAETTIVQAANPDDHVFEVTADYLNIGGFTVKGGRTGIYLNGGKFSSIFNNIVISNDRHGILLEYSSNNVLTQDIVNSNNGLGISLSYSNNNVLIKNTANSNKYSGIEIYYSNNNNLTENIANSNKEGWAGIFLAYSSKNILTENIAASNNGAGIRLDSFCSYNTLLRNTANMNEDHGILLITYFGYFDSYNTFIENVVNSNGYSGITISHCGSNTLTKNSVFNNAKYGIRLSKSSNNLIYFNNFIDNTENASSSVSTNTWHSPEEITYPYNGNTYTKYLGNYWSDYTGSDADGDGIGETPYSIDSDADNYPLVEPFENYQIGLAESPWPMFQHDRQNTGQSPYLGPQTSDVKWVYEGGDLRMRHAPVIGGDGTIYVGTKDGLLAINPEGVPLWLYNERPWVIGVPAIGNGGIIHYITTSHIVALNPDGTLRWEQPLYQYYPNVSPVVSEEGNLYLIAGFIFPDESASLSLITVTPDGTMDALFEIQKEVPPSHIPQITSPAIDHEGTIYFGYNYQLFAVEPTGALKWRLGFAEGSMGPPTISSDGMIYISAGNRFRAVNREGEIVWSSPSNAWTNLPAAISPDGTIYVSAGRLGWPGYVHNYLYAFDAQGKLLWEKHLSNYPYAYYSAPAVDASGTVYVLGYTDVRAYDPDGNEKWRAYTSHNALALSLGRDGTLYVPGGSQLYAFGPALADATPPTVSSASPEDGDTDVPIDTVVMATFSEAMDGSTITTDSFTIAGSTVSGTVTYDPATYTATFTPDANLEYDHEYTATLSTAITDSAGNPLAAAYSWSFTTESAPGDTTPPDTEVTSGPSGTIEYSDVTFAWTGSDDLTPTSELVYSYCLEGHDSDWSDWTFDIGKTYYGLPEGDYTFKVKAKDQSENIDITPAERSFVISPNEPPEADFTYLPEKPKAGEWVTFDASASHDDPGGEIVLYEWDWGNTGTINDRLVEPQITYYWDTSGTKQVRLIVTDNRGAKSEKTVDILIEEDSFWEKFKGIFEKEHKITDEELKLIKSERGLNIYNFPYPYPEENYYDPFSDMRANPDSNVDLYWYDDWDLRNALDKEIGEEAPGLTYGIYILNAINEVGMVDYVWSQEYKLKAGAFFNAMLDMNIGWSSVASGAAQQLLTGLLTEPYSSGASTLFLSYDIVQVGISIGTLQKLYFYNSLYRYLQERAEGITHEVAWKSIQRWGCEPYCVGMDERVPAKGLFESEAEYNKKLDELEIYYNNIWNVYGDALSDNQLDEFRHELKNKLREILYSVLLRHKPELLNWQVTGGKSPIELRVYDFEGNVTGVISGEAKEEVPYSVYGDKIKTVVVFFPSNSYRYQVVGTDEGTYGLDITFIEDGEATTFAATDIPTIPGAVHQYTIDWDALSQGEEGIAVQIDSDGDGEFEDTFTADEELSQDEFMLQTATTIDFDPDTLNLESKGKFVTVYIELPTGYNVGQIDISSVMLNDTVPALTKPTEVDDYDSDGVPDLMVKFDGDAVQDLLTPGSQVEITVTGEVAGIGFEGSDTMRVIDR